MFTNRFEMGVSNTRHLTGSMLGGLKAQLRTALLLSILFSVLAAQSVSFGDN
ncbi:MAG: hypothetical protein ACK514_13515 [Bacteroidota bacterium]|jgi:hypothetical protein|nr:hypothetical protein [Cytophagales bacterium]MCE2958456.1 hypothetical protein [Flammeovirgaceae bacterium]MCZ8069751.1 hypothetical protein [Cytophagales bacterium]